MKKLFIISLSFLILTSCSNLKSESISYESYNDGLWEVSNKSEKFTSNIIKSSKYSVSLWFKSDSNKIGSNIFKIGENISLNSLGYNEESKVYSGLTLTNQKDWIVADGINTIKTGRYNHIVVNFDNNKASIYMNGEKIASGKFNHKIKNNEIFIDNSDVKYSEFKLNSYLLKDEDIKKEYKNNLPKVLLDTINIQEKDDMINNYWLMDYKIDGYDVKWQSDRQDLIDYRGVILNKVEEDTVVTLKATLTIDNITSSKDFKVTLRKEDDKRLLQRDLETVSNYIDAVVNSGLSLPNVLENGTLVSWSVDNDNIKIENDKLIKLNDSDKEVFTITANLKKNNEQASKSYKISIIDETYAYLMAYFSGELEEEKVYLAYSEDGLNWEKINTVIDTDLGSKRLRDPFISRDKENNIVLCATEGFDNPNVYLFKSKDLIDFSNKKLIQVAYYNEALKMTGERAWAPEFIYDLDSEKYYLYFSDNGFKDKNQNVQGSIYAVTSSDLNEFSYPFIYLDTSYSIIDGTIIKLNGKNWMFYKDERKASQTIFYAESKNLKGFSKVYDEKFINLNKYMEGPFLFKDKEGGYFIYMDNYPNQVFYAGHFDKLGKDNNITWYNKNDIKLPDEEVRHGSVLPITKKEAEKVKAIMNK